MTWLPPFNFGQINTNWCLAIYIYDEDCVEKAQALKARYQYFKEKIQKFGDKIYAMIDRKFRGCSEDCQHEKMETIGEGKYTMGQKIGSGGFGEIYLGTHIRYGIDVAIK
mgnify:CR=1 FL=1